MKKLLYVILALSALHVQAGALNGISGITTFLHYGGGPSHGSIESVKMFPKQRAFLVCSAIQKGDLKLRVQPTDQNFKYDDYLTTCKNAGLDMIVSFQGKLDYQVVQGKSGKVNPVNDADDPMLESSWYDYGQLVRKFAIRYADDTQDFLSEADVYSSADYKNNVPKAGLGLVWAMSDRNEYDFKHGWSGAKYTMTPEQSAVGFKVFYESVRSVSKTMRIIAPSGISPSKDAIIRFINQFRAEYEAEGKPMPTDWMLDFHWYMRNGSADQTSGTWGITAETARAYQHGLWMDSIVDAYQLHGWVCTETGWATYTGTSGDLSLKKQNAPVMQGYDIYHAQGLATVRLYLIWGATKHCKAVTVWHCRDAYDTGPYYAGGMNYQNWSGKQGRFICEEYFAKYGNYDIRNFRQKDQLYAVDLYASADTVTLVWTDQNKFGEYDAKPRPGTLELPNQSPTLTVLSPTGAQVYIAPATVTLAVDATDNDGFVQRVEFYQNNTLLFTDTQYPYTHTVNNLSAGSYQFRVSAYDNLGLVTTINNIFVDVNPATQPQVLSLMPPVNHQFKWSDGVPVKISGHNSPENLFAYPNADFLDWLYVHGVNSIYCSVNNKESGKPQISVWKNNNPAEGFDDAKVNVWVNLAMYWLAKDPRNILQLVLFENETINLWTLDQQKAMITYLAQKFAACNGRIMINTEEPDMGWSRLNAIYDHIKQVWPSAIRLLHCNTGEKPWNGNYNTDRIHGLSIQADKSAFHGIMTTECPKHPHWFAIASEMTGGFQPNDIAKAEQIWNAGAPYNVGAEVYIACCDHRNTADGWYTAYAPVFDKLKELRTGSSGGGNPPPPTAQYTLNYSLNSTRQPNNTLHGASLSAGKIWVYIDVNADIPNRPLKFYYDNVYINPENGRPYELGGGNGYTVTDGQHEVKVLNAQNAQIAKATFTVGNIVVPPDTTTPPDTIIPPPVDTASFVVEFSTKWDRTQSVVAGSSITISQGSYWVFVREGVIPFTFTLIKNIDDIQYTNIDVDRPYYDLKASNQYFQRGVPYTIIVKDGTGAVKTIAVTVQ